MILKSMFSMAALNMFKAICSLLITFLVAKTVAPEAFGLVSFAVPLMAFITILTDMGMVSSIVRHPHLDRRDAGAAVSILMLAGALGGLILGLSAPFVERLVGLGGLSPVLAGFGLVTTLTIWAAPTRALLEREYRYKEVAAVELASLFLALVSCAIAIVGQKGIMAIVAYQVSLQLVRAIGFFVLSRRFREINVAWFRLRGLASVGGWLLVTNLLTYFARNLDNILIGSFLGAKALGIYGLAYQFMTLPLVLLTWPISGVLLSTLARLREDENAKRDVISAVIACTGAITFPMMAAFTFAAKIPLDLIYSHRWSGLEWAVALLAPAGAFQSVAAFCGAVLVEKGAVRLNLVLTVIICGSMVAVFFATVWFGLTTLIIGYMVVAIVASLINLHFICTAAGIAHRVMLKNLAPGVLAACIATAGTHFTVGLNPDNLYQWLEVLAVYCVIVALVWACFAPAIIRSVRALGRSSAGIGQAPMTASQ